MKHYGAVYIRTVIQIDTLFIAAYKGRKYLEERAPVALLRIHRKNFTRIQTMPYILKKELLSFFPHMAIATIPHLIVNQ